MAQAEHETLEFHGEEERPMEADLGNRAMLPISIDAGSQRCGECFEFLWYAAWAIAFWVKVEETNETECGSPVWFWGNFAKYFYLVSAVISLISQCFFPASILKGSVSDAFKLDKAFILFQYLVRLCGLPLIIGIFISYFSRDVCPNLSTIIAVQFWIMAICLGCMLCCCTCLGACALTGVIDLNALSQGSCSSRSRGGGRRADYKPV